MFNFSLDSGFRDIISIISLHSKWEALQLSLEYSIISSRNHFLLDFAAIRRPEDVDNFVGLSTIFEFVMKIKYAVSRFILRQSLKERAVGSSGFAFLIDNNRFVIIGYFHDQKLVSLFILQLVVTADDFFVRDDTEFHCIRSWYYLLIWILFINILRQIRYYLNTGVDINLCRNNDEGN